MKIVPGVAIVLALTVGGASAASPAQVAFTAGEFFDNGDVVVVDASGTVATNLTPGKANAYDDDRLPSWSPDGAKLAFVSHRDGNTTQEIYVMNADGSSPRRLTTDSGGSNQVFNVDPVWSPSGALIAWRKVTSSSADVWVMNADGSGKRRLTTDGSRKSTPQWSPDSKTLLFARQDPYSIQTVDVATATLRTLSPPGAFDATPSWSPDGKRIAFVGGENVYVMNADGSGRRQVSRMRGNAPQWSPDGKRIVFAGVRFGPPLSRFGPASRGDVVVVDADGANEEPLTGPLGDEFVFGGDSSAPSFWPDGSRIFFSTFRPGQAAQTMYVMNADGTCETVFTTKLPRLLPPPAWRPGAMPSLPPLSCVDLRLYVTPSSDAVALNGQLAYVVTIENDGTLPATSLALTATIPPPVQLRSVNVNDACTVGNSITCRLPSLAPGARLELMLIASFRGEGTFTARFAVGAAETDSDPSTDQVTVANTPVLPCTIVGSTGNDAIEGTVKGDRICARTGWDRIQGRSGNDRIDAGNGNDTIDAGKGRDSVIGSGGADVVLVRDGERDTVDCGTEHDVVVADRLDTVARNCEEVYRR